MFGRLEMLDLFSLREQRAVIVCIIFFVVLIV